MPAVRVHLADDRVVFREGLEAILASREDVEVVGRSSTGEEAATLVEQTKPDLVITQLDMELQRAEGILSGILEASPESKIIVLTMFDNLHYLMALSKMGIDAYIHKSSSSKDVVATIDALGRDQGGDNVVLSMPWSGWASGLWGRSRRGRRRCWC
jgi:DNA-binding NarL/FixJ family response regulator